ncbi:MAG: DUF5916 domain-containing protein [Vicinamibacterales bacterium]
MVNPYPSIRRRLCAFRHLAGSALIGAALGASELQAQQPPEPAGRRTVGAMRIEPGETITLDGNLDEAAWQRAEPARDFIQIDPRNGQPATERTEVRIAFSPESFYMGVTAYDSEPDKWIGYQRRRDEFLGSDDRFMWTIDTFLDAQSGYFFEMNPSGLMADSLLGVNGQNRAWDGIWDARVRHSDIGWTIEIEIPFRTLNFNPNSDTWGINFQRTVRRMNEDSIWMGWARNQGLQRMTNAGRVTGITDVTQGHGLDIKPYGLLTGEATPARGQRAFQNEKQVGVDLFYNPTPLLRANLTVNTDFAQTEVDQRQVNLTRFSLFFPEKRSFFLDGANFFDFASPTTGDLLINPFFTRRIGLGADATPQKIDFGTKLTGQVGSQDIGVLHVQTGDDDALVGEMFTAARVKRRLLRQSYLGAVYTRRDARVAGADARHTAGLDMRLATNRFRGSQNLSLASWVLHATRPDQSRGNSAFGMVLDYPNDRWDANLDVREVQQNFDPAIGFVTRRSYRRYQPTLAFAPRPRNSRVVRQYTYSGALDIQTDLKNDLLVRNLELQAFGAQFQSQEQFAVGIISRHERLEQPFNISRGITLPVGSNYDMIRVRATGQTANRRPVAINARFETGDFYSGTRREMVANLTFRIRPGYIVYMNSEFNRIRLAEGNFSTRLYRFTGETQFTPFMALVNNIQYDTVSAVAGWQSRFRWIVRPGSDVYVVYTHNWLDDPVLDRFSTQDKRFATKVLYTYRF